MDKRRSRAALSFAVALESLESRVVLSGVSSAAVLPQATAQVAVHSAKKVTTETTLAIGAGTLGQPITFSVTVRAPVSAGSPTGTVNLVDHGTVLGSLTLSPTSSSGKFAYSQATATLTQTPGGPAYYFGKHAISATFMPGGSFAKSTVSNAFTVSQPTYASIGNGVKVATIASGSGAMIQSGQTANVLYTGYLASNGTVFDNSIKDGGTPLAFTVGAGQVVPGFDAGTAGMQVGETRIIDIPASQGYGSTANGPIPANSNLIFVVTLKSIS